MNKLIAVVGMCGSGKSVACDYLEKNGYTKVYFGGVTMMVLKEQGLEVNPENEKTVRENLRKELGMGAYAIKLLPVISEALEKGNVVLDGLYSWDEYVILKEKFENIKLLAITADKDLRYNRLSTREIRPLTSEEATARDIAELNNLAKGSPIAFADFYILNNGDIDNYLKQLEDVSRRF